MKLQRVVSTGVFCVLLVSIVGCTTAPITGRRQLSLISAGQEVQLGISAFEQLKRQTPVSQNPAANDLVQRVGKRIAAVANEDLPEAQWEFVVFESRDANAFCLPGGKVGVYTGLLEVTKDEAGLATVIGHEIAHATARHGAERMSHALAAQTGGQLLGVALSAADPRVQSLVGLAYPAIAQVGVMLPFSRKQESEADFIGLVYMARAGYDPAAAVDFWTRFSEYNRRLGRSGGLALLRTHPVDSVRIRQLQEWVPEARAAAQSGEAIISTPAR